IRRSIEYPVTGVAVALRREREALADLRVAFTGTNPRPVLLKGTDELCGGALDARVFKGLDELVRDQIMSMKTTFTPGHYRRRVAGVLARRLLATLFGEGRAAILDVSAKEIEDTDQVLCLKDDVTRGSKRSPQQSKHDETHHARSRRRRCKVLRGSTADRAGVLPQRLAPIRLGHEEPARARVQSDDRPHGDARRRPRLLSGSDNRARAHRSLDRAAVAVLRRPV